MTFEYYNNSNFNNYEYIVLNVLGGLIKIYDMGYVHLEIYNCKMSINLLINVLDIICFSSFFIVK